jgi:hypothetical protein
LPTRLQGFGRTGQPPHSETKVDCDVMGNVISLNDKLKLSEHEKEAVARKRKILAARKIFQCSHCASKCERCGAGLSPENRVQAENTRIPYTFCDSCAEEYIDYIDKLQGKGDPDAYWQNHAWLKLWRAWIEYQGSVDHYLHSKEFRQLLDELRTDHHCDK